MSDLITKQEYKAYAGISSTTQDAQIDLLIPKVSQLVKTYCRRSFLDYYDEPLAEQFTGGTKFILAEGPVQTVISVEYSSDYGQTYAQLTEFVDWVLNKKDNLIEAIVRTGFPEALNGYVVTYTAGYEKTPEDLKLALLDLITYYMRNDSAIHSSKAAGTNNVQIEYISTTSLPAHIKRVLDQYVSDYT